MIASLADLKQHLNITSASDDEEIQLILDAAERVVSSIAGEWSPGTVTETVTVVGGTAILSRRPTGAVLTGGLAVGGTVDAAAGLVTDLGGAYGSTSRVTVTYPVGDDSAPADVYLATLIIAGHLWETQRGAAPVGPLAAADDTFATPGAGFAIPNRARELLAPYIRPSIA